MDNDGLDDAYDLDTGSADPVASAGLAPVNTDGDALADYLDSDSDNDLTDDVAERGDGGPTSTPAGPFNDADGDGLLDEFEGSNINDGFDVNDENLDPTNTNFNLAGVPALNPDGSNAVPLITDLLFRDTNDTPDAVDDTGLSTAEDTPLNIPVLGNDTDSDGDTLTVTAVDGLPITDGGAAVSVTNGTVSLVGSQLVFTPAPNYNGPFAFTYTVEDPSGASDTANVSGTVTPV